MSPGLSLEELLSPTPFWDLARDGNTWLIAGGGLHLVRESLSDLEESCSFMLLVRRSLAARDDVLELLTKECAGGRKESARAYWLDIAALASARLERMYGTAPEEGIVQERGPSWQESSLDNVLDGLPLPKALRSPLLIEKGRCTRFAAQESAGTCDLEFGGRRYTAAGVAAPAAIERELCSALAESLRRRMRRLARGLSEVTHGQQGCITLYEYTRKRVAFRLPVDGFALLKRGRCYAFPETELELEVLPGTKYAVLSSPAYIASPPYNHPFVYPDCRICHGQMERFTRQGIYFSMPYRRDRPEQLASAVAVALDEARKTLQGGYLSGVRPISRLAGGLFEENLITEEEARERGIKVYR